MTLTGQIGLRRHGSGFITRAIEWATYSHTHHAIVAVSETECVSAEPGGVRYRPISDYPHVDWSSFDLTDVQRGNIVLHARNLADAHTPYNYAVYPFLLAGRLTGLNVPKWISAWLQKRPNVDCSQASDQVYSASGIELFPADNVLTTPGDLERLFVERGWLPYEPVSTSIADLLGTNTTHGVADVDA